MKDIGRHILVDVYGVAPTLLMDEEKLMEAFFQALDQANFTIINHLSFKFPGGGSGVTGIFLLSESHAAFHTYPEIPYVALDIFSCGASDPETALAILLNVLRPEHFTKKLERRGENCRARMLDNRNVMSMSVE
jgi:S-adenosylmethionine decarboxylase